MLFHGVSTKVILFLLPVLAILLPIVIFLFRLQIFAAIIIAIVVVIWSKAISRQ